MKSIWILLLVGCLLGACSEESTGKSIEQLNKEVDREESNKKEESLEGPIETDTEVNLQEVETDDVSFVNNTGGNINAGGKYLIQDQIIYFANGMDNNHLYRMTVDGTDTQQLTDHAVGNLQLHGDWIYYTPLNEEGEFPFPQSLNKIHKDGSDEETIVNQPLDAVYASQEYLFFILEGSVYKMSMGDDQLMELPYQALTLNVSDDKLVYFNHDGYHLGDIEGETNEFLFLDSYGDYIVEENGLYYTIMDGESGLYRFDLKDGEISQLVTDSIDYFNIKEDSIYYSTANAEVNRSIYKVNLNGNQKKDLGTIIYSINIFDDYVIGEYARQGFVQYSLIHRDTDELVELYPQ